MKRHAAAAAAAVLAAGLVLTSCAPQDGGDTGEDGTAPLPTSVTIALTSDVESGDPANISQVEIYSVRQLMFEPLLEPTGDGQFEPWLATSWEMLDDVTYEFTLREDVVFHNGDPMTAEDVAYTFNRLVDPDKTFRSSSYLSSVDHAEAVSDYVVKVVLKRPFAPFLANLANARIVPAAYVEEVGDEQFAQEPVGTGPYQFVSWEHDQQFVLTQFDGYWGDAPAYKDVTFKPIPDGAARVSALLAGEVDVMNNVPVQNVAQLEATADVEVSIESTVSTFYVVFNTKNAPFDDVRVRQAFNYAVDVDGLAQTVMGGRVNPHGVFFGDGIVGWDPEIEDYKYAYDPDKARQLLAEAGYADGLTIQLDSPRARFPQDADLTQAIAAQLEAVGVTINLNITEGNTWVQEFVAGNIPQATLTYLGWNTMDADYGFNLQMSVNGRGYYNSTEFDAMFDAQRAEFDPAKRLDILHQMHIFTMEEAPAIFLFDMASSLAYSTAVCDVRANPMGALQVQELRPCE